MIHDALSLTSHEKLSADVCVVGGGPAGIALARRVSQRGARVVLLESGGLRPEPAAQSLGAGEILAEQYWALDTSRIRALGGTSHHWAGWCRPLDGLDFEKRGWVAHSGWPFGFDELSPYYEMAQQLVDLGPLEYDPGVWSEQLKRRFLPLSSGDIQNSVWQLSAPTHFGKKFQAELEASSRIDVWLHATGLRIDRHPKLPRIQSVVAVTPEGGLLEVHAGSFVLATGGIDNARLLLASEAAGVGLGNEHGVVGQFFLEHPHSRIGVLCCDDDNGVVAQYAGAIDIPGSRPPAIRLGLGLSEEVQRRERLLNVSFSLEPFVGDPPYPEVQAMASRSLSALRGTREHLRFELLVRSEQEPDAQSRVVLTRHRDRLGLPWAGLEWRRNPRTLNSIRFAAELLARSFGRLGLGHVYSYAHAGKDARASGAWPDIWGGHHHMGTTRMHDDPREGVVDRECRVHSVDNLFIAGSSVFPTAGYANPTLTLLALSLRLADRLTQAQS